MTELLQQQPNEHEPQHAVTAPDESVDESTEPAPVDVGALQQQATEAREQLEEAKTRGDTFYQALHFATMQQATGDILHAVSDMPADDPRYRDDAGFPSVEGMRAVAEELIASKPYLARVRGEVHQGVKETTAEPTWSDVLRGALG